MLTITKRSKHPVKGQHGIASNKKSKMKKKERSISPGDLSEDSNRIVIRQSFTNSNWKNLGPPTLTAIANETAHLAL